MSKAGLHPAVDALEAQKLALAVYKALNHPTRRSSVVAKFDQVFAATVCERRPSWEEDEEKFGNHRDAVLKLVLEWAGDPVKAKAALSPSPRSSAQQSDRQQLLL